MQELMSFFLGGVFFSIPISWGSPTNEITHFVGFQLDLVE